MSLFTIIMLVLLSPAILAFGLMAWVAFLSVIVSDILC